MINDENGGLVLADIQGKSGIYEISNYHVDVTHTHEHY